jgi:hypothetical protein
VNVHQSFGDTSISADDLVKWLEYLHAEEGSKKGTNDGEEIIEDWNGLGNDERHEAIESDTTADKFSKARMTSSDYLQPDHVVDRGVSGQVTSTT